MWSEYCTSAIYDPLLLKYWLVSDNTLFKEGTINFLILLNNDQSIIMHCITWINYANNESVE